MTSSHPESDTDKAADAAADVSASQFDSQFNQASFENGRWFPTGCCIRGI